MAERFDPVAVLQPTAVDDNGTWSISPEQRQALGRDLGLLVNQWAAQGPADNDNSVSSQTDTDPWPLAETGDSDGPAAGEGWR